MTQAFTDIWAQFATAITYFTQAPLYYVTAAFVVGLVVNFLASLLYRGQQ